jgi:hypothetical protein
MLRTSGPEPDPGEDLARRKSDRNLGACGGEPTVGNLAGVARTHGFGFIRMPALDERLGSRVNGQHGQDPQTGQTTLLQDPSGRLVGGDGIEPPALSV